jgi:hypothetical protein
MIWLARGVECTLGLIFLKLTTLYNMALQICIFEGSKGSKKTKMKPAIFTLGIFFLSLFSFAYKSEAKTWRTASWGYWGDSLTWEDHESPSSSSGDTFIIRHPAIFENSLSFIKGAYVEILGKGGLCAHKNITVYSGTQIVSKGIIELDTMFVTGGKVDIDSGNAIFTKDGILTVTGAELNVNGNASLSVGPWFTCHAPEYNEFAGIEEKEQPIFSLYPNPCSGTLWIHRSNPVQKAEIRIYNITGVMVLRLMLERSVTEKAIDVLKLEKGLYSLEIIEGEKAWRGKVTSLPSN